MHIGEHRQAGGYTKTDGTTTKVTDVWFRNNKGVTPYDIVPLLTQSKTIQASPESTGRTLDMANS